MTVLIASLISERCMNGVIKSEPELVPGTSGAKGAGQRTVRATPRNSVVTGLRGSASRRPLGWKQRPALTGCRFWPPPHRGNVTPGPGFREKVQDASYRRGSAEKQWESGSRRAPPSLSDVRRDTPGIATTWSDLDGMAATKGPPRSSRHKADRVTGDLSGAVGRSTPRAEARSRYCRHPSRARAPAHGPANRPRRRRRVRS